MLDEPGLEDFIFSRYSKRGDRLFRMERLSLYDTKEQRADRESWLKGRFDPTALKQWATVLADDARRGLVSSRARVLSRILTDDEAMSCHAALPIVGRDQEVRILHRGEHLVPDLLDHDYWVVETAGEDGEPPVAAVVRMVYSDGGEFLGAEVVPPAEHARYLRERDLAMAIGELFPQWWERHQELHRTMAA
jgi:hypothetical protein